MFPEGDWLELVTAVTEMVLQLRIDIRKETNTWFDLLFGKIPGETAISKNELFSL
jgi:hypothetical protein